MAKILITSGPTRQYLDPIRYLTNASSGLMGCGLAEAAIRLNHEVVIVSGPAEVDYPSQATVIPVVSTEEMLTAAIEVFASCDGLIGAAAPCDYRPRRIASQKIAKTGEPLALQLVETDDVVATLANEKKDRWVVGFALETQDVRLRALAKLERKCCDLMVSNHATAMRSQTNHVEVLSPDGTVLARLSGPKQEVGQGILAVIQSKLIEPRSKT